MLMIIFMQNFIFINLESKANIYLQQLQFNNLWDQFGALI